MTKNALLIAAKGTPDIVDRLNTDELYRNILADYICAPLPREFSVDSTRLHCPSHDRDTAYDLEVHFPL